VIPVGAGNQQQVRRWGQVGVLAGLNHPALPAVYDAGDDEDRGFAVTELVEGPTLAERFTAGGALTVGRGGGRGRSPTLCRGRRAVRRWRPRPRGGGRWVTTDGRGLRPLSASDAVRSTRQVEQGVRAGARCARVNVRQG